MPAAVPGREGEEHCHPAERRQPGRGESCHARHGVRPPTPLPEVAHALLTDGSEPRLARVPVPPRTGSPMGDTTARAVPFPHMLRRSILAAAAAGIAALAPSAAQAATAPATA